MDKIKPVLQIEGLTGRLRNVIERNRWFSLALLAGFLLRLLAMIGYPGALWFAGDSYVYVGAALRPQPNLSKSTGYSLFLRLLLPFHSFTLVTLVQHLMGLAVAVMIYALARRYGVSKKWATIATLPQLLDGYIIEDEHLIMAEAVFTFCLLLATLLLLWTTRTKWWVGLIAGLLVGYAIIDRTEGLPMLVIVPLFVLIKELRALGWRKLQGWLVTIAVAVGCLAPVGAYAAWFHDSTGSWGLTRSTGFYVWGRVSPFAVCSEIHASADVMKVCPADPVTKRSAPGNYIWHASVLQSQQAYINTIGGSVSVAGNSLLTKFDIAAIEAQPFDYLKAVVKGVLMSVEFPRQNYPGAGTVYYYDFHIHYVTSKYNMLPPNNPDHEWIHGGTAYSDWLSYGHQDPGVVIKPVAVLILGYQRIFYTWGPLFGLIMIMGLGGVLTIQRRQDRSRWALRLRWQRRSGSMFPWIAAVVLLVSPIALADFDYRYLIPVIPFACLAAGLGFAPVRAKPEPSAPAAGTGTAEEAEPARAMLRLPHGRRNLADFRPGAATRRAVAASGGIRRWRAARRAPVAALPAARPGEHRRPQSPARTLVTARRLLPSGTGRSAVGRTLAIRVLGARRVHRADRGLRAAPADDARLPFGTGKARLARGQRVVPVVPGGAARDVRPAGDGGDRGPVGGAVDIDRLDQRPERGADAQHPLEAGRGHGRPAGWAAPLLDARAVGS